MTLTDVEVELLAALITAQQRDMVAAHVSATTFVDSVSQWRVQMGARRAAYADRKARIRELLVKAQLRDPNPFETIEQWIAEVEKYKWFTSELRDEAASDLYVGLQRRLELMAAGAGVVGKGDFADKYSESPGAASPQAVTGGLSQSAGQKSDRGSIDLSGAKSAIVQTATPAAATLPKQIPAWVGRSVLTATGALAVLSIALAVLGSMTSRDSEDAATKVVLTAPAHGTKIEVGELLIIQGAATGGVVSRVDVIVDGAVYATIPGPDAGVREFFVPEVPWTPTAAGQHTVVLSAFGPKPNEKLLARSETAVISAFQPSVAVKPPAISDVQATGVVAPSPIPPTATPEPATLTVTNEFANVREGPGIGYEKLGEIGQNERAVVLGRTADSSWYVIEYGRTVGWTIADYVLVNEAAKNAPIVVAPPLFMPSPEPTSEYLPLSGYISRGVKVYMGAGPKKSYLFTVLGGSSDCATIDRGIYVRYPNGSDEWKDRDTFILADLYFVRRDDPAVKARDWREYRDCP